MKGYFCVLVTLECLSLKFHYKPSKSLFLYNTHIYCCSNSNHVALMHFLRGENLIQGAEAKHTRYE